MCWLLLGLLKLRLKGARREPLLLRNLLTIILNHFRVLSWFLYLNNVRSSFPILSGPNQDLLLQLFKHGIALHLVVCASQFHSFFASACRTGNLASALWSEITRVTILLNDWGRQTIIKGLLLFYYLTCFLLVYHLKPLLLNQHLQLILHVPSGLAVALTRLAHVHDDSLQLTLLNLWRLPPTRDVRTAWIRRQSLRYRCRVVLLLLYRCWSWFTIIVGLIVTPSTTRRSLLLAYGRDIRLTALISLHLIRLIDPFLLLGCAAIVTIARIHHHYHLCSSLNHLTWCCIHCSTSSTRGTISSHRQSLLNWSPLLVLIGVEVSLGRSGLNYFSWRNRMMRDHWLVMGSSWWPQLVLVWRDNTLHTSWILLELLSLLLLIVNSLGCLL